MFLSFIRQFLAIRQRDGGKTRKRSKKDKKANHSRSEGRSAYRGHRDVSPPQERRRDGVASNGSHSGRDRTVENGRGGGKSVSDKAWLRSNIRVRVVHKSYAGGRAYLGKGKVVDVPRVGEATVRMDHDDVVLEGKFTVSF